MFQIISVGGNLANLNSRKPNSHIYLIPIYNESVALAAGFFCEEIFENK